MSTNQATTHDNAHTKFDTRPIWRTFWILLVITLVELALATIHLKTGFPPKHVLNGVYLILTCAKAFYIIAEFMHLRHEIKNLIMTLAIPACLFIWFILAFILDGNSYRTLRNRYDPYHVEQNNTKIAPAGGEEAPAGKQEGPAAVKPGEQQ
jgi:cytochrome c oxidase subunit 4